jgi:MFS family permease
MGTLSDRAGKRKPFILYGYILWGISTVIFPMSAFIRATSLAVILVIAADALMTFFGSTAYDSAFNAWTTDISDRTNRGSLTSVIAVLPFLAAVISAGLSGMVIDSLGYYTFFLTLGIAVSIMGLIGGLLLKDSPKLRKASRSEARGFFSHLFSVFTPGCIRRNRELFLVLSAIGLFSIGVQVFLPYLMIYVNNYLKIDKSAAGVIMAIAIFASMLLAIPAGKLADRGHVKKLALASPFVMLAGLLLFSVSRSFYQVAATAIVLYFGIILLTLSTSAWIKNLMPEESRGQFEGVRMIFNVALPMIIGPAIGSALITHFGIATVSNGEAGFIPTPIIFQVAGVLSVTSIIPILMIVKSKPERNQVPPDLRA